MQHVRVPGGNLEIKQIAGERAAPTLVFLHHGLGCVDLWRDFPERMVAAAGCPALIYSRLGKGRSDPCSWPHPITYQRDEGLVTLPAVLGALNLDDVILIGHSDGATIALIYAGSVGDHVRGVVAEAPHLFFDHAHDVAITKARDDYRAADGKLRGALARYHEHVDSAFYSWAETWLTPEFKTSWNVEELIRGARCPVLAIRGTDDPYGTHDQVHRLKPLIDGPIDTRIIDGGHAPHEENPDAMVSMMGAFVESLLGPNDSPIKSAS